MDNITIIEDDNDIIDIISSKGDKNIFKLLDENLNKHGGIILASITEDNIKKPCIVMKFTREGDTGLGLIISKTNTVDPLLPCIALSLEEFNIKLTIEEFIQKYLKVNHTN